MADNDAQNEKYISPVLPLPPQDEADLNIKYNLLTWMIDLLGIDTFLISDENEKLPMTTIVEARYVLAMELHIILLLENIICLISLSLLSYY